MSVERIYESPRVTKPYTDEQWAAIVALGHAVDADLAAHDVRLTMGGEPTFVSADDRDGDEWNIAALGPTKRLRAADLLWRLQGALRRQRRSSTSARASGIPASSCRAGRSAATGARDGEPVWRDARSFADETAPDGHDRGGRRAIHPGARRLAWV